MPYVTPPKPSSRFSSSKKRPASSDVLRAPRVLFWHGHGNHKRAAKTPQYGTRLMMVFAWGFLWLATHNYTYSRAQRKDLTIQRHPNPDPDLPPVYVCSVTGYVMEDFTTPVHVSLST